MKLALALIVAFLTGLAVGALLSGLAMRSAWSEKHTEAVEL